MYYVTVGLPNHVAIENLRVNSCNLPEHVDMLIGMDIIAHGDFHISNCGNNTVFTFKVPSFDLKDYVKEIENARLFVSKQTPPKKKKK